MNQNHAYAIHEPIGYAGDAVLQYLYRFFLPVNLSVIYPYPQNKFLSLGIGEKYILIILLAFTCFKLYRSQKKLLLFGLLFFITNLLLMILSAMALRDQIIPACANVTAEEIEFPNLRLATGKAQPAALRTTLNTSLGFGGEKHMHRAGQTSAPSPPVLRGRGRGEGDLPMTNVPMPIEKPLTPALSPGVPGEREKSRDVLITGIGIILPGITGNEAFLASLNSDHPPAWTRDAGPVPEEQLHGLLNARRVRRMSDYVKLTLAATTLACRDAGIPDADAAAENCAAILASTHGSSNYSEAYYRQIINEGLAAANPMLFAEAVPNGGAAQLSLMLGLKGACQAVIGTRTAGIDAMTLAAARIRRGAWDRAIVGAGEEFSPLVNQAYRHCELAAVEGCAPFTGQTGFVIGAGAVTFILESRASLERRGGQSRGRIEASSAARGKRPGAIDSAGRVFRDLGSSANVLSSACGTWIDRAEAAAIRHTGGVRKVSSIHGHVAETFSVSSLAGIAATLLSGKMPRLLGNGCNGDVPAASGEDRADSFSAICTDFTGCVSGVRIGVGSA